jgi:hypothetical protein
MQLGWDFSRRVTIGLTLAAPVLLTAGTEIFLRGSDRMVLRLTGITLAALGIVALGVPRWSTGRLVGKLASTLPFLGYLVQACWRFPGLLKEPMPPPMGALLALVLHAIMIIAFASGGMAFFTGQIVPWFVPIRHLLRYPLAIVTGSEATMIDSNVEKKTPRRLRLRAYLYGTLAIAVGMDFINCWHIYLGQASPFHGTAFGTTWSLLIESFYGDFYYKNTPFVLFDIVFFLYLIKEIAKISRDRRPIRRPRDETSIFVKIFACNFSKRLAICAVPAFMMTAFLWYTCRHPGKQVLEFLLTPSWLMGSLPSGDMSSPEPLIYWPFTIFTWLCIFLYVIHLLEILTQGTQLPVEPPTNHRTFGDVR